MWHAARMGDGPMPESETRHTGASRNALLDAVRGVAICLVVAGHTQAPAAVVTPIYAFHMPLFLLLTGATYNYAANRASFRTYAARRFRRLLLPYFATAPFFYLVWLLVGRRFGEQAALAVSPLKPLLGIPYASGANHWLVFNVALWYLPAVWVAKMAFWGTHRVTEGAPQWWLGVTVTVAALAGWAIGRVAFLPWSADVALVALPFLYAGLRLRRGGWFDADTVGARRRWAVFAGALATWLAAVWWNGRVDMMGREYGNLAVFYLGGVAGTLALVELVRPALRWAPFARVTTWLGRESMLILVFHLLGIRVFSAVLGVALPAGAAATRQALWWLYVPVAVAFSLAVAAVIRRVRWLAPIFYADASGTARVAHDHDPREREEVVRTVARDTPTRARPYPVQLGAAPRDGRSRAPDA
jgi:fucose 4-O-acetylase-like acetyltransferase